MYRCVMGIQLARLSAVSHADGSYHNDLLKLSSVSHLTEPDRAADTLLCIVEYITMYRCVGGFAAGTPDKVSDGKCG